MPASPSQALASIFSKPATNSQAPGTGSRDAKQARRSPGVSPATRPRAAGGSSSPAPPPATPTPPPARLPYRPAIAAAGATGSSAVTPRSSPSTRVSSNGEKSGGSGSSSSASGSGAGTAAAAAAAGDKGKRPARQQQPRQATGAGVGNGGAGSGPRSQPPDTGAGTGGSGADASAGAGAGVQVVRGGALGGGGSCSTRTYTRLHKLTGVMNRTVSNLCQHDGPRHNQVARSGGILLLCEVVFAHTLSFSLFYPHRKTDAASDRLTGQPAPPQNILSNDPSVTVRARARSISRDSRS